MAVGQRILSWRYEKTDYSGSSLEKEAAIEVESFSKALSSEILHPSSLGSVREGSSDARSAESGGNSAPLLAGDGVEVAPFWKRIDARPQAFQERTLSPMQEWEGYVEDIRDTTFVARLSNVKDRLGLPADEAEFEMRELSESDRSMLRIGSIVRWVVGFERLPTDQRQKVSRLHVRRLPTFRKKDLEKSREEARLLIMGLFEDGKEDI